MEVMGWGGVGDADTEGPGDRRGQEDIEEVLKTYLSKTNFKILK